MKEMTLKEAKRIAGRVDARVIDESEGDQIAFKVVIAGRGRQTVGGKIVYGNVFYASSPQDAAKTAVLETGKHAKALYELAKQVYVEEDIL